MRQCWDPWRGRDAASSWQSYDVVVGLATSDFWLRGAAQQLGQTPQIYTL